MATTKIDSSSAIKNNGGTVVLGGNANTNGSITNVPDGNILGPNVSPLKHAYGPSALTGTAKAVSAGDFGINNSLVILGGHIIDELAGVSNDAIVTPAADIARESVNTITNRITVLIDSWDYATGVPTYNSSNPSSDSFGTDYATSNPGKLTFSYGAPTPERTTY